MSQAARHTYSDLYTTVGSGGVISETIPRPKKKTARQVKIDQAFANAAVMPVFWLGIGTGSMLVGQLYTDNLPTGTDRGRLSPYFAAHPGGTSAPRELQATWKRHLATIKQGFSITTTQLAQFLRVERPSVYQWFDDTEPRQRNLDRIRTLEELSRTWIEQRLGSIRPYIGFQDREDGATLGDLLSAPRLDPDAIEQAFTRIAEQEQHVAEEQISLTERLAARGFSPYDDETQKRTRAASIKSTSPGEDSA